MLCVKIELRILVCIALMAKAEYLLNCSIDLQSLLGSCTKLMNSLFFAWNRTRGGEIKYNSNFMYYFFYIIVNLRFLTHLFWFLNVWTSAEGKTAMQSWVKCYIYAPN
jgi:hypothetical protein